MGQQFWACDRCGKHISFDVESNRAMIYRFKHRLDYFIQRQELPREPEPLDFCDACIVVVRATFEDEESDHERRDD